MRRRSAHAPTAQKGPSDPATIWQQLPLASQQQFAHQLAELIRRARETALREGNSHDH